MTVGQQVVLFIFILLPGQAVVAFETALPVSLWCGRMPLFRIALIIYGLHSMWSWYKKWLQLIGPAGHFFSVIVIFVGFFAFILGMVPDPLFQISLWPPAHLVHPGACTKHKLNILTFKTFTLNWSRDYWQLEVLLHLMMLWYLTMQTMITNDFIIHLHHHHHLASICFFSSTFYNSYLKSPPSSRLL